MPRPYASRASATMPSTEVLKTPGMDATARRTPSPSVTNSGRIRSAAVTSVSRTSERRMGVARMRRGR
jgi:hypothetical protein